MKESKGKKNETNEEKRTTEFRWQSRYELYDYFRNNFQLTKEQIDEEIVRVMESFKPRKGRAIKTQELWQKVGLNLEKKIYPHP
ncbi:MAG: hypothetical protein N2053_07180 [Chitinispirillaceae bacterium]|nr:hypothetical protein [Chitinispirillaceae bacterium]